MFSAHRRTGNWTNVHGRRASGLLTVTKASRCRTWLFAETLAPRKRAAHDAEVMAVATLLHDLGLTAAFDGPLRFEVEGANVARAFARKEGMNDHRAQLVWDGVALNSTPSIEVAFDGGLPAQFAVQ
jgi:hypothetical protein